MKTLSLPPDFSASARNIDDGTGVDFTNLSRRTVLIGAIYLACFSVFIFDITTNIAWASGLLYIPMVLTGAVYRSALAEWRLGAIAIFMTVLGMFLPELNPQLWLGLANRLLSIGAILGTAWFVHHQKQARRRLHQQTILALAAQAQAEASQAQLQAEIIERKRAEASLAETKAMFQRSMQKSAVGEMAAFIAHEINQPLSAIILNAYACQRWLGRHPLDLGEITRAVNSILSEANRSSEIVAGIRALLRKQPNTAPCDINALVNEVITLTHDDCERRGVTIITHLAEDIPIFPVDRLQLQQCLLNLIMNGIEAMDSITANPRRLTLSTSLAAPTSLSAAGCVLIQVADTGQGIAPSDGNRIFDAFFTTKDTGMGMGLQICRSIVEAHGGYIRARPGASMGSVFEVGLPVPAEQLP